MAKKSFRLMMNDELVDYFRTLPLALAFGRQVNLNRVRSSESSKRKQPIKIVHDTPLETKVVYEGY